VPVAYPPAPPAPPVTQLPPSRPPPPPPAPHSFTVIDVTSAGTTNTWGPLVPVKTFESGKGWTPGPAMPSQFVPSQPWNCVPVHRIWPAAVQVVPPDVSSANDVALPPPPAPEPSRCSGANSSPLSIFTPTHRVSSVSAVERAREVSSTPFSATLK
jgi:hypothetical protein